MGVRWKRIRGLAVTILRESGITRPPVDVRGIVREKGLSIVSNTDGDNDISGILFLNGNQSVIGVNGTHSPERQRFTIAHELGHYLLHRYDTGNVHVDRGFQVKLRSDLSSQGTDVEEREANYFAAEILMPAHFLATDLKNVQNIDLEDDQIQRLAQDYKVSQQAMLFRLANLRYISL